MTRYTFDPRIERTLNKRARKCRTFSVGIQDMQLPPWQRTVARMRGLSEHAHAIRAAAQAFCDWNNARDGVRPTDRATVVVLSSQGEHAEARVVVRGRVVAQCGSFDNGLNEAWAGLIASLLNTAVGAWPVGDEGDGGSKGGEVKP